MALVPFSALPISGRLFIFSADRQLTNPEAHLLAEALAQFLGQWTAHGEKVDSGFEIRRNQFVLIGTSDTAAKPSGCSVDALTRFVRSTGEKLNVDLMSSPKVFYLEHDEVRVSDRTEFKEFAKQGKVSPDTHVFNTSLSSLAELREGGWEMEAKNSWHNRFFATALHPA